MRALVLGEQVVEWLVLVWADFLGDGFVPFVGVGELRIDVKNDAPERKNPVPDDLPDLEFGDVLGNRAVVIPLIDLVGEYERLALGRLPHPEPGTQPACRSTSTGHFQLLW